MVRLGKFLISNYGYGLFTVLLMMLCLPETKAATDPSASANPVGNCQYACLVVMSEGGHEGNGDAGGVMRNFVQANDCSKFEGVTKVFPEHTLQREYSKLRFIGSRDGSSRARKVNAIAIANLAKLYKELQGKFPGLKVSVLSAPGPGDKGRSLAFAKQVGNDLAKAGVQDVLIDREPINPRLGRGISS